MSTTESYVCIKPQCQPGKCIGCNSAISPTDEAARLVLDLLNDLAVDGLGAPFEDGDHSVVDRARSWLQNRTSHSQCLHQISETSPAAVAVPDAQAMRAAGIEQVAQMLQKRADAYAEEHLHTDPDTGTTEGSEAHLEYWNWLVELVDDVRALLAGVSAPAAPALAIPDECPHLIWYDDQDRPQEMFAGKEAKAAAMHRFAQISQQWNAHLFVRIEKNSRDCQYPVAAVAAPQAPAADALDAALPKIPPFPEERPRPDIKGFKTIGEFRAAEIQWDMDRLRDDVEWLRARDSLCPSSTGCRHACTKGACCRIAAQAAQGGEA